MGCNKLGFGVGSKKNSAQVLEALFMQNTFLLGLKVFLASGLLALGASAEPIMVENFTVNVDDNGAYVLQTDVEVEKTYEGEVSIPVEGMVIVSGGRRQVLESNVLGTGFALDLDADAKTESRFSLFEGADRKSFGSLEVEPFEASDGSQRLDLAKVYHLSDEGPGFFVYRADRERIQVGLDYKHQKAEILKFPNPVFQFMLLEPCEKPGSPPGLKLDGATVTTYLWEPGLFGEDTWAVVQTRFVPVGQELRFVVSGEGRGLALGRVNFAREDGVRRKTKPAVGPVGSWK